MSILSAHPDHLSPNQGTTHIMCALGPVSSQTQRTQRKHLALRKNSRKHLAYVALLALRCVNVALRALRLLTSRRVYGSRPEAEMARSWSPCVGGCRRRWLASARAACRRPAARRCRSAVRSGRRRAAVRCRRCCCTGSVRRALRQTSTSFQLPLSACSRRGSPTFSVRARHITQQPVRLLHYVDDAKCIVVTAVCVPV